MEHLLTACRAEIDRIDRDLLKLVAERFRVVDRVIAIKKQHGLPAAIPDRIEVVVAQAVKAAQEAGIPTDAVEELWRKLVELTIAYERKCRVTG